MKNYCQHTHYALTQTVTSTCHGPVTRVGEELQSARVPPGNHFQANRKSGDDAHSNLYFQVRSKYVIYWLRSTPSYNL
jgi:hypothetical protein